MDLSMLYQKTIVIDINFMNSIVSWKKLNLIKAVVLDIRKEIGEINVIIAVQINSETKGGSDGWCRTRRRTQACWRKSRTTTKSCANRRAVKKIAHSFAPSYFFSAAKSKVSAIV